MTASDYPVTFPYGATGAGYTSAHPHRGDDRACPSGTPVVVNGQTIGLTGATGKVTGPHLHIQEWSGNVANVRKPQNSFKGGKVVAASSSSDFGNYVTIQTPDGWNDSYCHLSKINVAVGQQIGEKKVSFIEPSEVRATFAAFKEPLPEKDVGYYSRHAEGYIELYRALLKAKFAQLEALQNQPASEAQAKLDQIKKIVN